MKLKAQTEQTSLTVPGNNYGYDQDLCKHYTCCRVNEPIHVDGLLDKPSWQLAEKSPRFVDLVSGKTVALDTRAALLWDDENLYVAFWVQEPDIQATLTERDSLIWNDNDVEIFIAGQDCYYEFEINAFGTVFEVLYVWQDAYKHGNRFNIPELDLLTQKVEVLGGGYDYRTHPRKGRWAFREWDMQGMQSAVKINGTINKSDDIDEGWTVELAFPWSGMKLLAGDKSLPPRNGDVWRMDLSRFQKFRDRDSMINPGWAWNTHGTYDSHIPELFTYIHFTDKIVGEANS